MYYVSVYVCVWRGGEGDRVCIFVLKYVVSFTEGRGQNIGDILTHLVVLIPFYLYAYATDTQYTLIWNCFR